MNMRRLVRGLLVMSVATSVLAEDGVIVIEGARIRGNQELPNVLYVVPWKPLDQKSLYESSAGALVNPNRMEPLYREEFVRLVQYYDQFQSQNQPKEVKSVE
ncbi:MAG: hypothetical protein IPM37_12890 [Hahellaceae bacterium]|nr:hypothetical protein [Hahellaceae bacterium]